MLKKQIISAAGSLLILFACFFLPQCHEARNTKAATTEKRTMINSAIALVPYTGFDTGLLNFIDSGVAGFYHFNIIRFSSQPLPSFAFYPARNRYKADSLLLFEKALIQPGIAAVVGLTDKDISTSSRGVPDWGIFGLGLCPGKACVVSVYRLKKSAGSEEKFKERLIKVILHELGHNLGLPHCNADPQCLMNDAGGKIAQVDRERKWLCDSCRTKLKQNQ